MGNRNSTANSERKKKSITLCIPEELLEQVNQKSEGLHMNRSAYICQVLKKGTVTQNVLTEEEMALFKELGKAVNDDLMVNVEIMLQQKRDGSLTLEQELIFNKNADNLTAIRRKMEQTKEA